MLKGVAVGQTAQHNTSQRGYALAAVGSAVLKYSTKSLLGVRVEQYIRGTRTKSALYTPKTLQKQGW